MPNVTTLEANETVFVQVFNPYVQLDVYADILGEPVAHDEADVSTILPFLSTLSIELFDLCAIAGPKHFCRLIQNLWENGRPIQILDLTKISPGISPDLSMLEEVPGLKVIWKLPDVAIQEYTCGSGEPEKLPYRFDGAPRRSFTDNFYDLSIEEQS